MYRKYSCTTSQLMVSVFMIGCVFTFATNWSRAEEKMSFTLTSAAFDYGGVIPSKYTCEGKDLSPPLHWEGVPEHSQSLVLIMDDPDVPDPKAPKRTWVHWVLYNIPPNTTGFSENIAPGSLPSGTEEGLNDWKRTGYGGPCPPIGRHRYFHTLYALDTVLTKLQNPTKARLLATIKDHIIAKVELVVTYEKSK